MSWDVDLSWVGTSIYHDLGPRILSSLPACLPACRPSSRVYKSVTRSVCRRPCSQSLRSGFPNLCWCHLVQWRNGMRAVLFLGICFGAILPIIHPSTGTSSTGYCVWVQILIFWIHDNLWLQSSIFLLAIRCQKKILKITSGKIKCFLRFSIAIIRPS
jgi:hypothetical protein